MLELVDHVKHPALQKRRGRSRAPVTRGGAIKFRERNLTRKVKRVQVHHPMEASGYRSPPRFITRDLNSALAILMIAREVIRGRHLEPEERRPWQFCSGKRGGPAIGKLKIFGE